VRSVSPGDLSILTSACLPSSAHLRLSDLVSGSPVSVPCLMVGGSSLDQLTRPSECGIWRQESVIS
jgi:hypothetical protein